MTTHTPLLPFPTDDDNENITHSVSAKSPLPHMVQHAVQDYRSRTDSKHARVARKASKQQYFTFDDQSIGGGIAGVSPNEHRSTAAEVPPDSRNPAQEPSLGNRDHAPTTRSEQRSGFRHSISSQAESRTTTAHTSRVSSRRQNSRQPLFDDIDHAVIDDRPPQQL
ncbi:MAG: hypothetical protein U0930_26635, partial [Pirellulales bacterium]